MNKKSFRILLPLLLCLLLTLLPAVQAETAAVLRREEIVETGPADSSVSYPVFSGADEAANEAADRINRAVQEQARIPDYLALLSSIMEGSAGLRMTYECSNDSVWNDAAKAYTLPSCISVLFSAKGKMLMGRPSQVYYPLTLDTLTGEQIGFDDLFTDPEGAKAYIEACLEEEIEPQLSTYLENSQLFPVPYDRFFLDGFGRLIIVYENSQLSFLSGYSGAVAFRYSELWDYLDTSPEGVPMQALWHDGVRYDWSRSDGGSFDESNAEWIYDDTLYGLSADVYLGQPLEEALEKHRATVDSGYYPGGAYYEVENAALRGTLILTNEQETEVTGLLTGRVDHFGIETGKTSLADAESLLSAAPVRVTVDEAAAEMYLVCPGTASAYSYKDADGRKIEFTLYADEGGTVRYIKLAFTE